MFSRVKSVLLMMLLAVVLAACGMIAQSPTPTESPSAPDRPVAATAQTSESKPTDTQSPTAEMKQVTLVPGKAYIEGSELQVAESDPVQVYLHVWGNKPTPCHILTYEVSEPDEDNRIEVSLATEVDPNQMCIQILDPFDERISIPMEGAQEGTYTVWLNGELVGEFSYPA